MQIEKLIKHIIFFWYPTTNKNKNTSRKYRNTDSIRNRNKNRYPIIEVCTIACTRTAHLYGNRTGSKAMETTKIIMNVITIESAKERCKTKRCHKMGRALSWNVR